MKKMLFILIIFAFSVEAQNLSYTWQHLDTIIVDLTVAKIKIDGQIIDGSVTAGEVCELTSSGWNEADASVEATADGILGIYIGSNEILLQGIYTTTGLTAGSLYWLSETEGQWTSIKPTSSGTIVKFIGQAISTTKLLIYNNIWGEN